MNRHEAAVFRWFSSWLDRDASSIDELFAADAVYSECYGPVYRGMDQIRRWFDDWNQKGRVLEWPIREFIHQENKTVVSWFFRCEYEGGIGGFDGVSIIEFDDEGKIIRVREFQSKAEHILPYGDNEGIL